MTKKIKSNTSLIRTIAVVFIVLLFSLVLIAINNKSKSSISSKSDVEAYLKENYEEQSFVIGEKNSITVKSETDSNCEFSGYKWSVEAKKTGIKFTVYDYASEKCTSTIHDDYDQNVYNYLKEKYDLEDYNGNFTLLLDTSKYSSLEEASNKAYEILEQFNFKSINYGFDFYLRNGDEVVRLKAKEINNFEDIINLF